MPHIFAHLNTIRGEDIPNDGDGDRHFSEMKVDGSCFVEVRLHFPLRGPTLPKSRLSGNFRVGERFRGPALRTALLR